MPVVVLEVIPLVLQRHRKKWPVGTPSALIPQSLLPLGGTVMAKPLVSDALWQRIEPLLPPPKPRRARSPGRRPLDYRKVLTGIIFVLKTGINWEDLPAELGWGCGKTCKHYLKAWYRAGVWHGVHQLLLLDLQEADKIDWSRGAVDSTKARAWAAATTPALLHPAFLKAHSASGCVE